MMRKFKSKKGFTLAELLIVVAIIAVLVAVAIPVFSAQLEKSREAVDMENARAANSMAMVDYLTNHSDVEDIQYMLALDKNNNLEIVSCSYAIHGGGCTIPEHTRHIMYSDEYNYDYAKSEKCKDSWCYCITVTINNGKIVSNNFLEALGAAS